MAFRSGKGTHHATATLYDSKGNVKATGHWQSGNMTPNEKALGFPKSSLATHTEARITVDLKDLAKPGDLLEIIGEYAPCKSCTRKNERF
ncbi:hypothetical protein [Citrobacter enshiensis]|uniref:hypothetical protein n=1 Tax=Citrobacter enshiensis TaxID=2971264 RepID=UPI00399D607C